MDAVDAEWTRRGRRTLEQASAGRRSFSPRPASSFPSSPFRGILFSRTLFYLHSSSGFAACGRFYQHVIGPCSRTPQPSSVSAASFVLRRVKPADSFGKRVLL